jgi:transcriptional regulator with XRE-family HTH domain
MRLFYGRLLSSALPTKLAGFKLAGMLKMTKLPENSGASSLRLRLAQDRPGFSAAVEMEERVEAFCQDIRSQLKQRREKLSLDQSSVAAKLEVSQSAISKIENGSGDIGLKTLFRYADALGVKPLILFMQSKDQIADQIIERRGIADKITEARGEANREYAEAAVAADAVQEVQEHLLRTMSDVLPEMAVKLASA